MKKENVLTNNGIFKVEKGLRITSVELVDIINQFREEEFEILKEKGLNKKAKYTELRHNDFMTKIKKELETLKALGLGDERNISLISYIDDMNREKPCFSLNRDGMLQMLNSESTIVRAKTINYINKLEQVNKELTEDLVEVSKIAISDKEQAKREYETKKKLYGYKRIKNVLENCTYKDIEDTVNDIIDFHVNKLKKKDRAYSYNELDKTSYKQVIRDRIDDVLENIYNTTLDGTLRVVAKELQYINQKDKIKTINRSNSHKGCTTSSN